MKLVFSGFENPLELEAGETSVLQVENGALFARVASSLKSGCGHYALEPYSFWDEEREVMPKDALMFVSDPLSLPWDDKTLLSAVVKQIEREFLEDEDLRMEVEEAEGALRQKLELLDMGFNADIGFALEWDLKRYLKFLGFGIAFQEEKTFLDNLLNFLSYALDAGCKKVICLVNLKTFLTKNELEQLYEHIFFLKLRVLLLENKHDDSSYEHERKIAIDLQFLEHR